MKAVLFLLLVIVSLARPVGANPYPEIFVDPIDGMDYPRLLGIPDARGGQDGGRSHYADVTITLLNWGEPWPNAFVEVVINPACTGVSICESAQLTGFTDENGQLTLNMALGGCCDLPNAVVIHAGCMPLVHLNMLVSPDWDGAEGDGSILLDDYIMFGEGFSGGLAGCTDYTGDGTTDVADLIIFGTGAWGRSCPVH